jgi:hypothetical protein
MYSGEELELVVSNFRETEHPIRLQKASDIKSHPNDILFNYYISSENLSREQIKNSLLDLESLNEILECCVPDEIDENLLPKVNPDYLYEDFPCYMAKYLETVTDKFSVGTTFSLLIGDAEKKIYAFPSGRKIEYYSFKNEICANNSVLDFGFGKLNGDIFVRQSSMNFILGFMDVVGHDLPEYKEQIRDFENYVEAIVIAHEMVEIENYLHGLIGELETTEDWLRRELMSEEGSKKFLLENGIDEKYYELYHLLYVSYDEHRGLTPSRIIVDNNFEPKPSLSSLACPRPN